MSSSPPTPTPGHPTAAPTPVRGAAIRPRARARAHRVLTLVLALVTVLGLVALPATASRGAESGEEATGSRPAVLGGENASDSQGLTVRIDDLEPRVLTDQSEVRVSGTLTNTGSEALDAPTLTVFVQVSTPVTQAQLTAFLSGQSYAGRRVATQTLQGSLAAGSSTRFSMSIPTSDLPLSGSFHWGPRGLSVQASSGASTGVDRTLLVWDSGYEVSPTEIGALVPWTSATATGSEEEHGALLDLAGTTGVTLAVDPEALSSSSDEDASSGTTSLGATPSTSPSSSQSPSDASDPTDTTSAAVVFAHELMSTASEIVALPRWDSDLGALTLGKSDNLLDLALSTRDDFDGSVTTSSSSPAAQDSDQSGASSTPSSTATPTSSSTTSTSTDDTDTDDGAGTGTPTDTDDDTATTATIVHDVVWPTAESFGLQVLDRFQDQVVIAPPGAVAPSQDLTFTSMTRVEVSPTTGQSSTHGATDSTTTVLTSQEAISSLLAWDPTSTADTLDAEQVLTALGAMITRELPNQSRTLLALVPRGTTVDQGLVGRVRALVDQRWISGKSFTEIADSEPTDVTREQVGKATDLDESTSLAFSAIGDALTRITPLSEAISDPEALTARVENQALKMLSATSDAQERTAGVNQLREQVDDLLSSVSAEPSVTINLVNKSAKFPVRVTNDLPWDVKVRVTLDPSDPRLGVDHPTETTLPAGSTTSVEVPVSAIGSGNIRVGLVIETASGVVLDDSQDVEVRMRAGWEDTLTKTAAGLLGLLFLVGIVRTVRRRSHAGAPGLSEGAADAPAGLEWVRVDEDGDAPVPPGDDPTDTGTTPEPRDCEPPGAGPTAPTGTTAETGTPDHEDSDETVREDR